jgi:hypothetical protein
MSCSASKMHWYFDAYPWAVAADLAELGVPMPA